MSSATSAGTSAGADAPDPFEDGPARSDDRTARARIRDAALQLFGERGFRAATVRDIADRADVSPALVLHHFGSKQGLRESVDEQLLADMRAGKLAAMTGGLLVNRSQYAEMAAQYEPAVAYLVRALAEDTDVGRHLYDRMWADTVEYLEAGVEAGVVEASDDPSARAAVLMNAGLAQALLLPHLRRVLDVDEDAATLRIAALMLDLYTDGLFTDDRFRAAWRAESDHVARVADPDPPAASAAPGPPAS